MACREVPQSRSILEEPNANFQPRENKALHKICIFCAENVTCYIQTAKSYIRSAHDTG